MKLHGLIADHVTPKVSDGDVCFTLTGGFSHGGGINYVVYERKDEQMKSYGFDQGTFRDIGIAWYEECSKTLVNGTCAGYHNAVLLDNDMETIVRRLTPKECERLQGFPDDWTLIPDTVVNGKVVKASDGARYKALGNSICLPHWYLIFQQMREYLPENPKLGSLFDGIGGFPLLWEDLYGEGSARWGSEIEPFPIAVTMNRFPEKDDYE